MYRALDRAKFSQAWSRIYFKCLAQCQVLRKLINCCYKYFVCLFHVILTATWYFSFYKWEIGSHGLDRTGLVSHDSQAIEEGGFEPWFVWLQSSSFCCIPPPPLEEGRKGRGSQNSEKVLRGPPSLFITSAIRILVWVSVTRMILWSYQHAEKYERKELFSLSCGLSWQANPRLICFLGFLCLSP